MRIKIHHNSRRIIPSLINRHKCRIGVEIGVYKAAYSERLLEKSCLEVLYGVDIYSEEFLYFSKETPVQVETEARKRMERFGEDFRLLIGESTEVAQWFEDGFFDFVYIDGDHHLENVLADLRSWWPKVRSGGVFSGHDFVSKGKTKRVEKALRIFFGDSVRIHVTMEQAPSWWIIKD